MPIHYAQITKYTISWYGNIISMWLDTVLIYIHKQAEHVLWGQWTWPRRISPGSFAGRLRDSWCPQRQKSRGQNSGNLQKREKTWNRKENTAWIIFSGQLIASRNRFALEFDQSTGQRGTKTVSTAMYKHVRMFHHTTSTDWEMEHGFEPLGLWFERTSLYVEPKGWNRCFTNSNKSLERSDPWNF